MTNAKTKAETTKAETTTQNAGDETLAPAGRMHPGSCHCGAVRFQVELADRLGGSCCNCSICLKTNITGAIVKPAGFELLAGAENLSSYEWGGKTSRRYFCGLCGVHCFARGYLVEVGGDYISINLNAIDDLEVDQLPLVYWDGRHNNWYAGTRATPWPIFASPPAAWSDPVRPAPAPNS
jgi:hypothetical protein